MGIFLTKYAPLYFDQIYIVALHQSLALFVDSPVRDHCVHMIQMTELIQVVGIDLGGIRQQIDPGRHLKDMALETGFR